MPWLPWPNPIVTFLFTKIRKPFVDSYREVIQDKWFSDPEERVDLSKDSLSFHEARQLAYVELLRVLLDHTEFLERYTQISILYLRTLVGSAEYIDILRTRPWQV